MQEEFYSNGKLLLSGEYAILDGALGLAVPTKYGQSLKVATSASGILDWTSLDEKDCVWFQGKFELANFKVLSSSDPAVAKSLTGLLSEAKRQNPNFLLDSRGARVVTQLGFSRSWGLGSSSTLINNMAQWSHTNAYQLLWNAFGGSGYDIACAQHDHPITYQLQNGMPKVNEVSFDPSFKESLYFVHLNRKKSSKDAIAAYRKQRSEKEHLIQNISSLTQKMTHASSLSEFESAMEQHEALLSKILQVPTVKAQLFQDYTGSIKSLGAWGGDFVLATGNEQTLDYFSSKGFTTVIPYSKMVL
ncbi:MAG: GYDIA family GHMP kinase [Allomuricauda sp.]